MGKVMIDRLGNELKAGDHVHFDAPSTSLICRIKEIRDAGQIAQVGGMRGGKQQAIIQPASMVIVTEFTVVSPDVDRPMADNCLKIVIPGVAQESTLLKQ